MMIEPGLRSFADEKNMTCRRTRNDNVGEMFMVGQKAPNSEAGIE
jgi:hypothetical protein